MKTITFEVEDSEYSTIENKAADFEETVEEFARRMFTDTARGLRSIQDFEKGEAIKQAFLAADDNQKQTFQELASQIAPVEEAVNPIDPLSLNK
jgi:phage anti-repressor protein